MLQRLSTSTLIIYLQYKTYQRRMNNFKRNLISYNNFI